jgi:DUF1680 family protein
LIQSWAKFNELPLNAIEPKHWLKRYLEKQRDGLTGYLEVAGMPFDSDGWMADDLKPGPANTNWWHYEQYAYWVDGMIRCGYLISDSSLTEKAEKQIDHVLHHADPDGYLGPGVLKPIREWHRWPHAVFFRAMMAYHSATGDDRIVEALAAHYLNSSYEHDLGRDVCNIEPILWAYERTGNPKLLRIADRAYQNYNRLYAASDTSQESLLSQERAHEHGVTYNEIAKLGALLYMHTGDEVPLQATVNAYRKLDRDQMLVDGVCSSSEALRGKDPLDSHETCDIADYTWSAGYLLMATGDAEYADKIERACLNAAPGAVRDDFKALQYFSCPNQIIADYRSNHNYFYRGSAWMSYRPAPGTECCTGQVNRIMPNYVSRMWLQDENGGITAALYGPSVLKVRLRDTQQEVTIIEDTHYPFSERIDFHFRLKVPQTFSFGFRIPGWCHKAKAFFNGEELALRLHPGRFFRIEQEFSDGDRIRLILPAEIQYRKWPRGGISIERGPLVYALPVREDWQVDHDDSRSTPSFPAWNLYPASPWNYALLLDRGAVDGSIEVVEAEVSDEPWKSGSTAITLRVPARRVRDWRVDRRSVIASWGPERRRRIRGDFVFTPQLPKPRSLEARLEGPVEMITLVPYGCTRLRITIFPHIRS